MQDEPEKSGRHSLRILVIEDEHDVLDMLEEVLSGEGHRVVTAPGGQAGLDWIERQPFDIVLTDLNMPAVSGWDIADRVKKLRPSVPVVLLTGLALELGQAELAAKGIDCLIKKPFAITDIFTAISELSGSADSPE